MEKDYKIYLDSTYTDALTDLPKNIKAKAITALNKFFTSSDSKGLHPEKISNGLWSARVDDNYRIIFSMPGDNKIILLLFIGTHEKAYNWANNHRIELNTEIGSLNVVKNVTPRITKKDDKILSRLSALWDKHLSAMKISDEYWADLRTKVYNKAQLVAYKAFISESAYHALEYILEGVNVEEAMQLYDIEQTNVVPVKLDEVQPMFALVSDVDLIEIGIPVEQIEMVKLIKTESDFEFVTADLPPLAVQSLHEIRQGKSIQDIKKDTFGTAKKISEDNFEAALENCITLAEFAPIDSEEALQAFIDYPALKWRSYLHPLQRQLAYRDYNGAAQVIGGAGTGKTVVIAHRAKYLASKCNNGDKIFVTSYTKTLASDLQSRIELLCKSEEMSRIEVINIDKYMSDNIKSNNIRRIIYSGGAKNEPVTIDSIWNQAIQNTGIKDFSVEFCVEEFRDVIQEQNVLDIQDYLDAQRFGRTKQMGREQRTRFWNLSREYIAICNKYKVCDRERAGNLLADIVKNDPRKQYKHVLVDECQDLRASDLRLLRALAGEPKVNDIYLSGDSRQRIYNTKTSFSQCGININNRSRSLTLNYRTTYEIYEFAKKLLKTYSYDDMNGKPINEQKTDCIFRGETPQVKNYETHEQEIEDIIRDIRLRLKYGIKEQEICIMTRTNSQLTALKTMLDNKGLRTLKCTNQQKDDAEIEGVRIMTMHRSKGMEYNYVYLPELNENTMPPEKDYKKAKEDGNEDELVKNESSILYVAITRAKKFAWLSYCGKPSALLGVFLQK